MLSEILFYVYRGYACLLTLCICYLGINLYIGRGEKIRQGYLFRFFARWFKLILFSHLFFGAVIGELGWIEVFFLLFVLVFYGLCIGGDWYLERLAKKNDPDNDDY